MNKFKHHYYYDGIGNYTRFSRIGIPIHFDSMGRRVNYISLNGKFVGWIDE